MATIMESFVGNYLLNKLVAFGEEKLAIIVGVKDELKKLERRMRRIGAYLKDAERRRITDDSINNWLSELKDVMYDADDMIDYWRYNNQSLSTSEPLPSSNTPTCCPFPLLSCFQSIPMRHEIAMQVQSLNVRLEEILKDMSSLNLEHIKSEPVAVTRMDACSSSPIIGVDVVGNEIENDAKKLVKMAVMDNKQKFNFVAITGMGGIGKTTLSQKIYNNPTIQNRYAIKIWLSISQTYSHAQLIKEAIRNAGGNHGHAERESELLPILVNTISEKSFFLVLDDVWDPDVWVNLFMDPLKANASQGLILVTTRDQRVAMEMGAKHIHQMTVLSHKSGWELLCKKAYLNDVEDIKNLEDVGTKIVKKCGGLPLAIKAIAGMLASKSNNKIEWEYVLNNNVWSINGLPKEIDRALYLSYEELSPPLKQCFLYCSLYPSYIYLHDIIEDWIAEGFIEERRDQIMEDIAEEYYNELIRRHLLEPDLFFVQHARCRMHDLIRSLAQHLSIRESSCEDKEVRDRNAVATLRRLSIAKTNKSVCIPGQATEVLRLRTFIVFDCQSQIESHIFGRLKHLRMLYINEKGFNNIPESIGDLIHLRKLDLDRTSISNLPESIGSLTNLEFLNIAECDLLHTLPRGITRLCNLCHLNLLRTPLTSVPKGLKGLHKLSVIRGFQVVGDGGHDKDQNGWDLQELEQLSQLRWIDIQKLERAKNVSAVLATKTHLKELGLFFSPVFESSSQMEELENENNLEILEMLCPPIGLEKLLIEFYRDKKFPSWMSSSSLGSLLSNLQHLQFSQLPFCTDLPPLGLLPNLKYLGVIGASAIVRINLEFLGIRVWRGPNLPSAFPKLECLVFEDMPNWEEWILSDFEDEKSPSWQLMPRIKRLHVERCPKLRALPEGLQQLIAVKDRFVVRGANSMRSIQDFMFECELLVISNNWRLKTLSNLTGVKKLQVISAPNLRHVTHLVSLEYLSLVDYEMRCLPEWLIELIEERKDHSGDKLHLDLFCNKTLLKRCLKDGPDWPTIKRFFSVSVYNEERSASLEYTREHEVYCANL